MCGKMIEDHVIVEDTDDENEDDVGKWNYLQTEAMWSGSGIRGCPDYASDLSAFNLCHDCIWLARCAFLSPVIPGA